MGWSTATARCPCPRLPAGGGEGEGGRLMQGSCHSERSEESWAGAARPSRPFVRLRRTQGDGTQWRGVPRPHRVHVGGGQARGGEGEGGRLMCNPICPTCH